MSRKKNKEGEVYTPGYIVFDMIRLTRRFSHNGFRFLQKHIIDNSCGDGAFLCQIVTVYIVDYKAEHGMSSDGLVEELETYIHGIEIKQNSVDKCIENLNDVVKSHGVEGTVHWDIKCANALTVHDYDGKMDYVFGNPPYIRMKDVKKGNENNEEYKILKSYSFAQNGMSDLYLAFYELGLRMLNETGIMCYISPSSWFTSKSARTMRKYIYDNKILKYVQDYEDIQVFDNAQTYVAISLFNKSGDNKHITIEEGTSPCETKIISYSYAFTPDDDYKFYPGGIMNISNKSCGKHVEVKNGYATLCDDVFINKLPELSKYTIPVVKASTGEEKRCLFPYDKDLNIIPLETIEKEAPDVYNYINEHSEELKNRTYDKKSQWYSLGRSQGINDTYKKKYSISTMACYPFSDMKLKEIKPGTGVYSGLYILTDEKYSTIKEAFECPKFQDYIKSLRRYKSGGYYCIGSKEVEAYLNWYIDNKEHRLKIINKLNNTK